MCFGRRLSFSSGPHRIPSCQSGLWFRIVSVSLPFRSRESTASKESGYVSASTPTSGGPNSPESADDGGGGGAFRPPEVISLLSDSFVSSFGHLPTSQEGPVVDESGRGETSAGRPSLYPCDWADCCAPFDLADGRLDHILEVSHSLHCRMTT